MHKNNNKYNSEYFLVFFPPLLTAPLPFLGSNALFLFFVIIGFPKKLSK